MNKNTIFIIVLCCCIAFAAIDFISNKYLNKVNLTANLEVVEKKQNYYEKIIQKVDAEIKLKSQIETQTIFTKFKF